MHGEGANQADVTRAGIMSRTLLLIRELISAEQLTDEEIVSRLAGVKILLVADARNLSCAAGQHALVTAFNLVARLGVAVGLDMPDVPMIGLQPPLEGSLLRSALVAFSNHLFPGQHLVDPATADMVLVIGDTPWADRNRPGFRLAGGDWHGEVAPVTDQVPCWQGSFPIGPLTAAAMAAPEVFKFALGRLGVPPVPGRSAHLAAVTHAAHQVGEPLPTTGAWNVDVDFISAGAITHAVVYTLARVPGLQIRGRTFDGDSLEHHNQNRYMLARWRDMRKMKAVQLAECVPSNWSLTACTAPFSPSSPPLAEFVIVGTDAIEPRWWAQAQSPRWLGVGSTSHFDVVVSEHEPDRPCAGCLHHRADDGDGLIPTVSFVSFWSGLLVAARLLRRLIAGPVAADHQQTYLCPLRLDSPHSRIDSPVHPHPDCPVQCDASKNSTVTSR